MIFLAIYLVVTSGWVFAHAFSPLFRSSVETEFARTGRILIPERRIPYAVVASAVWPLSFAIIFGRFILGLAMAPFVRPLLCDSCKEEQ